MRASAHRVVNAVFVRFALVGSINTTIDLVLFLVLHNDGVPMLIANFVSTSCGLGFSFVANRSFTFKQRGGDGARKQLLTFLLGTGVGLWLVQPAVIAGTGAILIGTTLAPEARTCVAKAIAIVLGVAWNWLLYSKWVFRPTPTTAPALSGVSAGTERAAL